MTKKRDDDDFQPARIISKPGDSESEEAGQSEVDIELEDSDEPTVEAADTTDRHDDSAENAVNSSYQFVDTTDQDQITVFEEISYPLGLNEKTFWETPYSLQKKGFFKDVYKQSADDAVLTMKGVFRFGLSHLLLFAGYFYAAFFFDNDEKKMASKNPYKKVSVSELARKLGGIWTRQLVTDCLKAAFVDMQLRNNGHHFGNLTVDHLIQLARLKNQKDRLKFAKEADRDGLNAGDLRDKIDLKLGKKTTVTEDKRKIKALTAKLRELIRMFNDSETSEILEDRDRLEEALTNTEILEFLNGLKSINEKFSGPEKKSIEELAKTLVDLQLSKLAAIKLE